MKKKSAKQSPIAKKLTATRAQLTKVEDQFLATFNEKGRVNALLAHAGDKLTQALGLVRSAADQFAARGVEATAEHLRREADRLNPPDTVTGWAGRNMTPEESLAVEINRARSKES